MAILDYDDELSTAGGQAITAAAICGRVKDGGVARDWAAGEPVFPFMRVTGTAAFNPTTSATVEILAADDALLTENPVVLSTKSILAAALGANTLHPLPALLPGFKKRYLGAKVTPVGGDATTGKVIVGFIEQSARSANVVSTL
jgi:hypothetical protein